VKAHRHALVRDAVVVTAKDIGVTPQDLVSELKSGKSLADVAGEHNVSSQTLVNDLVTAGEAKVNAAASANKITSAEASKINSALPARVTTLVNHTFK
jgi:lambda repressor-like predicted transcriptional regulator